MKISVIGQVKCDIFFDNLLLQSLGRYLCWWTINSWGHHQNSRRCFRRTIVLMNNYMNYINISINFISNVSHCVSRSVVCSILWYERWFFVLVMLMELLTIFLFINIPFSRCLRENRLIFIHLLSHLHYRLPSGVVLNYIFYIERKQDLDHSTITDCVDLIIAIWFGNSKFR
jgi:hypothetical protein